MTPSYIYDAVFYEAFEEEEKVLREKLPASKRYFFTWKTIQESGHETPPGPVISTRTQSFFPPEWADKIEAIITRSTGYDHVEAYLKQTAARHISAAYLPDYAARAVAEQALMMWTALLRNLNMQTAAFKTFHRDGLTGREIKGRRIAVLGVGRIGSQIVDIAHGLGMNIVGIDINPREELKNRYDLHYEDIETALSSAEIAVCALPLTEKTRNMLNYKMLSLMPSGSIFINIARGEISPASDLLKLLKENKLAGIGLDVYDYEKELVSVLRAGKKAADLKGDSAESVNAVMELQKSDKVILTPHNAFNTLESVERKSIRTAENLDRYFRTGTFLTPVSIS